MPGVISPPHLSGRDVFQDRSATEEYMRRLWYMATHLTFLDSDGGITSGRRSLNIDGVWVQYVSNAVANTEDTVSHNLDRIPAGFWPGTPNKAGVVYDSGTAWTKTTVFLKADVSSLTINLWFY